MRKVLLSLAVAGAFTCVASAGDLTLYGVVDTGLSYKSIDWDGASAYKNKGGDSFSIESGINSSSRFGLRGSEEIGDGVIVGFVLENGFDSDTGSLTDDDRFFNRESQLFVKTQFGTLSGIYTNEFTIPRSGFHLHNFVYLTGSHMFSTPRVSVAIP